MAKTCRVPRGERVGVYGGREALPGSMLSVSAARRIGFQTRLRAFTNQLDTCGVCDRAEDDVKQLDPWGRMIERVGSEGSNFFTFALQQGNVKAIEVAVR